MRHRSSVCLAFRLSKFTFSLATRATDLRRLHTFRIAVVEGEEEEEEQNKRRKKKDEEKARR